jgi:Flp pilus assembly pilin Flp
MKLKNIFNKFFNDESGAVTVDWVVLTAAIVGLGLVVMNTVGNGINGFGTNVATDLTSNANGGHFVAN